MIGVEEYKELKAKVERLKAKASKAEGVYEAAMERLKELGFDSVEDADQGLEKLKMEEKQAQKEFDDELSSFQKRWGEVLSSM